MLAAFAGNPLAAKASVNVLAVDFTSATTASVTFNLCESGAPALSGSAGQSVLQAAVWKVAESPCDLVKLNSGGSAVPAAPERCGRFRAHHRRRAVPLGAVALLLAALPLAACGSRLPERDFTGAPRHPPPTARHRSPSAWSRR
ncbi:hypothetical protein GXW82_02435 [Streptacidiphilus sp. 4-A2]|nr:hypothetical protein [Streptacidiphilus sp. 4-A2]